MSYDESNEFKKFLLNRWLLRITVFIGTITIVTAAFPGFIESLLLIRSSEPGFKTISQEDVFNDRIARLDTMLTILGERELRDSSRLPDGFQLYIENEFSNLKRGVRENANATLALRQYFEPVNPDEVLTIARLKDEVKAIKVDQLNYQKQVDNALLNMNKRIEDRNSFYDLILNAFLIAIGALVVDYVVKRYMSYKAQKMAVEKGDNGNESKD